MKTKKQWDNSGQSLTEFLKTGDTVNKEMVDYFLGVLPPKTWTANCIQLGEPYDTDMYGRLIYMTLEKIDCEWTWAGCKVAPNN